MPSFGNVLRLRGRTKGLWVVIAAGQISGPTITAAPVVTTQDLLLNDGVDYLLLSDGTTKIKLVHP